MKYDIQNRNDFITGSYLVVKIPENELDQCALHTIQADCPDFIIPFHYKSTDGQIEFVYRIGTLCKLQYFSGDLSPVEYAELWQSLLKPLLECVDWYMNPCSFILSADCLYYDKNKKAVRYVYVPTAYGCSGYDAFYEMAVEVSKMMTVSDAVLENKVLREILKDFNPVEFLQMLQDHVAEGITDPGDVPVPECSKDPEIQKITEISNHPDTRDTAGLYTSSMAANDASDDIIIDIRSDVDPEKTSRDREVGGYKIFSRKSKRKKKPQSGLSVKASQKNLPVKSMIPAEQDISTQLSVLDTIKQADIIDITQSASIITDGPGLRYVGCAHLPPSIQIMISEGEIFTIGRFDTTIGKKQSNFEFDKKTRAVSRRHAVIERDIEGYKIVDLSSSAGTFVNDKKLPPNTPYGLETGFRVSFGNSGADYVWEVS